LVFPLFIIHYPLSSSPALVFPLFIIHYSLSIILQSSFGFSIIHYSLSIILQSSFGFSIIHYSLFIIHYPTVQLWFFHYSLFIIHYSLNLRGENTIVPSITEIKDKIQQVVQQHNRLKAEIDLAKTEEEAARKTAQVEKLSSQINTLRLMLAKLEAPQRQAIDQKPKTVAPVIEEKNKVVTTEVSDNTTVSNKPVLKKKAVKRTLEDAILVEQRISQIEQSQKKTREQLQKFTVVKDELTRSKEEAEKHVVRVTQQSYLTNRQLQQEIVSLTAQLQLSEARYENLKKEIDTAHYQTERETKSLTEQLNAALEKQNQLEKERARLFRSRGSEGFWNGLLIGLGISMIGISTFLVIAFMTPWLEEVVCHSQSVQTPLPNEESNR
jgi:hypothetical protein